MGCRWHLAYLGSDSENTQRPAPPHQRNKMSKTASFGLAPSASLFSRLIATIDQVLLAYAEINIRNGDVLRCNV
jgi:hypothetical protein